jgi:hypothetical protein
MAKIGHSKAISRMKTIKLWVQGEDIKGRYLTCGAYTSITIPPEPQVG